MRSLFCCTGIPIYGEWAKICLAVSCESTTFAAVKVCGILFSFDNVLYAN